MEESLAQGQTTALEKLGSVVLDIDNLTQSSEKCSGSPKMTKALSRKGSCRMERRGNEEQEADDASKKFVVKVASSQLDLLKQPLITTKALVTVNSTVNNSNVADAGDGRSKRFSRLSTIHPRKILLFFATIALFSDKKSGYFRRGSPGMILTLHCSVKKTHSPGVLTVDSICRIYSNKSSMGTMILIYFTLAINRSGGS